MHLEEALRSHLSYRFPNIQMAFADDPNQVVTIPFPSPAMGSLIVSIAGEGLILFFGDITHSHFDSYTQGESQETRFNEICTRLCDLLKDLFNDRILLWKADHGKAGGWKRVEPSTPNSIGASYFLWSGPILKPRNSEPADGHTKQKSNTPWWQFWAR